MRLFLTVVIFAMAAWLGALLAACQSRNGWRSCDCPADEEIKFARLRVVEPSAAPELIGADVDVTLDRVVGAHATARSRLLRSSADL